MLLLLQLPDGAVELVADPAFFVERREGHEPAVIVLLLIATEVFLQVFFGLAIDLTYDDAGVYAVGSGLGQLRRHEFYRIAVIAGGYCRRRLQGDRLQLLEVLTPEAQLAVQVRVLVILQREDILLAGQRGVIVQLPLEGVVGQTRLVLFDGVEVQLSRNGAVVLHAVAAVVLHIHDTVGIALHGHAVEPRELRRRLRGQAERQLAVLEEKELAAAVGRTHQEVEERLVILHQIGLYLLRRRACAVFVFQVLQVRNLCRHQ